MKKFIIFSLVAVMVAGMAFAQFADGISINAWGRGVFAPLVNVGAAKAYGEKVDGNVAENYAGEGITWGGPSPRTDFRVNGNAEFVGFKVQLTEGGVAEADDAYIWAKPFSNDYAKLTVGRFMVDDLRGKVDTDTGFENFVLGDYSGDIIFQRFDSEGKAFILSSQPIDALFIGAMFKGPLWNWGGPTSGTKAADVYKYMQIGLGYNIEGIGHVRAQWIGGNMTTKAEKNIQKKLDADWAPTKKVLSATAPAVIGYDEAGNSIYGAKLDPATDYDDALNLDALKPSGYDANPASIQLAFALTAVENLLVDIGFRVYMPTKADVSYSFSNAVKTLYTVDKYEYKDDNAASQGIDIGLGANFSADAFNIKASINATGIAAKTHDDKAKPGFNLGVNLIPSYALDFATLGLSLGMRMHTESKYDGDGKKDNSIQFGFGAFAQKNLGGGSVKAGVALALPASKTGMVKGEEKTGLNGSTVLSIPIILEYAFF